MNKLELANTILERCRLDTIESFEDSILEQFPYNNLESFMDEAIASFSDEQIWTWGKTDSNLTYLVGTAIYNLKDYDIDPKVLEKVFIPNPDYPEDEDKAQTVAIISSYEFKQSYANSNESGKPKCCYKESSFLEFYPMPDQDYGIKVRHYKQVPFLVSETSEIEVIPQQLQDPIVNYACSCMAMIVEKKSSNNFDDNYMRGLSRATQDNQTNDGVIQLDSNIDWW